MKNIKQIFKKMDKGILTLLILFFVLTPIVLTPWIHGNDGAGYYSYVRSIFIDRDLDFKNEREHYNQTMKIKSIDIDPNTHKYFIQYPIGTSLLWTPYFLVGHAIAFISGSALDGYSLPYVYMVTLGSAINAFIGMILIYLMLKKYFKQSIALLSVITMWFASNLFYYMYFESSMSHANSFFMASLVIFFWEKHFRKRTTYQWGFLGLLIGLVILIRYQNIIFLFLPFIEVVPYYIFFKKDYIFKNIRKHLIFIIVFLLTILPQLILLKIKHGVLLPNNYGGTALNLLIIPLNFLKVLFSSQHGLFNWTPILLFAFIGLFIFYKKRKIIALSFIIIFLMNLLIVSGWPSWYGAQSFSHRMFINTLPLLIFGLAALLDKLNKKISLKYLIGICTLFILWNFGLMIQYGTRMISVGDAVSLKERFFNNFITVPKKFLTILWKFLFSRGSFLR